jgi:hypothetical protein
LRLHAFVAIVDAVMAIPKAIGIVVDANVAIADAIAIIPDVFVALANALVRFADALVTWRRLWSSLPMPGSQTHLRRTFGRLLLRRWQALGG